MKEHPILFSTEMVQAIIAGRKTETRRIMKSNSSNMFFDENTGCWNEKNDPISGENIRNHYGERNDILWVRETWAKISTYPEPDCFGKYLYKSMGDTPEKWTPSIFMSKKAARIWLRIENIFPQKLQDISEEDAIKEGIEKIPSKVFTHPQYKNYYDDKDIYCSSYESFKSLWKSINGEESWKENPWVWVIKFKILSTTRRPDNI